MLTKFISSAAFPTCKSRKSFTITCIFFSTVVLLPQFITVFAIDPIYKSKCDDTLFSKPYVTLRLNKNGPDVENLETLGVIDLRERIRSFVCINGPVILYNDVSVDEDTINAAPGTLSHIAKIKPGETIRFSNGTFGVFNHKCMPINRIPRSELVRLESQKITPSVDASTPVQGLKVTGIFLIATEEPYDFTKSSPVKVMFNQMEFSYEIGSSENIISDASFIASGIGPYCLKMPDNSMVVLSSTAKDDKEVCQWTPSDTDSPSKDYKHVFHKNHKREDFKWEDCPPDILKTFSSSVTDPDPKANEPFAMLNPLSVAPHGSRRGGKLSGGDDWPPSDDSLIASNITCSYRPSDPACDQESDFPITPEEEEDTSAPPKNVLFHLGNCVPLPKNDPKDEICKFLENADLNCEKVTLVLELDSNPPPATPVLTLEGNPLLEWKHEFLSLVATIFSKICLPIRKQSVFQLVSVVGNYIASAHTADLGNSQYKHLVNKTYIWDTIISSLKRCNKSPYTRPMEWDWPVNSEDSFVPVPADMSDGVGRKKREAADNVDMYSDIEELFEEIVMLHEPTRDVPLIQRSAPVFEYDPEDSSRPELVFATVPRWKRFPSTDKIPLPFIQEYFPPSNDKNMNKHDDYVMHPDPKQLRVKDYPNQEIFYYEDAIELHMDLNMAVDALWKVWATVIGYCQMNEKARGTEIFSLLFNSFDEFFLKLVADKWTSPLPDLEVEMVLGEFMDEDRSRWLDTCLETAYIVSTSLPYRHPRPLEIKLEADAKEFGKTNSSKVESNKFVEMPEDFENLEGNSDSKYFSRSKKYG